MPLISYEAAHYVVRGGMTYAARTLGCQGSHDHRDRGHRVNRGKRGNEEDGGKCWRH